MSIEHRRIFVAVNLGHLIIDVFNSMGPVLLTFLSVSLGLSTGEIGFAAGFYLLLAGVTQPAFGALADRVGSRWLGPGSVAWTVLWLALALRAAETTQSFPIFLVPFFLAALGSGAFHPQGTAHAGQGLGGHAATATAIFFFCGQGGLASGPFLAGLLLDTTGPWGIYVLAVAVAPVVAYMGWRMRCALPEPGSSLPDPESPGRTVPQGRLGAVSLLAAVTLLRGWAFMGTAFFLPKLFQDLGWSATAYGGITGFYWLGGGIAGIAAGRMADLWGRRKVVFSSTLVGSLALFVLPVSDGGAAFLLAVVSGGLLGASHSILIVMFQNLLPFRRALSSGLCLGYTFGIGAVVGWCNGILAEEWGLSSVLQAGAVVGGVGAVLSLLLPSTRSRKPAAGYPSPVTSSPSGPGNQAPAPVAVAHGRGTSRES